jgi:hypothetical protein
MAPLVLGTLVEVGAKVFDRLFPDPAQADAAKLELLKLQQSGELAQMTGQMEINKVEAAHPSLLVSGWRPMSGWICNAGLAYNFVLHPMLSWLSSAMKWPVPPAIDVESLMVLLVPLLGLGAYRTVEKVKGRTK